MDYSYLVKKKLGDVILRTILLKLKNKDVIEKSLCSSRYINLKIKSSKIPPIRYFAAIIIMYRVRFRRITCASQNHLIFSF